MPVSVYFIGVSATQELKIPDGIFIDHVTCGSAHSIIWSSMRRKIVCKLPDKVPMEYNHLQDIPIPVLRNRLVLLHHFSNQFCKSLSLFGLQPNFSDIMGMGHEAKGVFGGFDRLRYILLSSSKVHTKNCSLPRCSLSPCFSSPSFPLLFPPPLPSPSPSSSSPPYTSCLFLDTIFILITMVNPSPQFCPVLPLYRKLRSDGWSRLPWPRASSMGPALNSTASR